MIAPIYLFLISSRSVQHSFFTVECICYFNIVFNYVVTNFYSAYFTVFFVAFKTFHLAFMLPWIISIIRYNSQWFDFFSYNFFFVLFAVSNKVNCLLIWVKLDSIFDIFWLSSSFSWCSLCSIFFLFSNCLERLIIFDGIRQQRPHRTQQKMHFSSEIPLLYVLV